MKNLKMIINALIKQIFLVCLWLTLRMIKALRGNIITMVLINQRPNKECSSKPLHARPLSRRKITKHSQNYSFTDQESELNTIAKWAKDINFNNPEKKIGIVIPNLNDSAAFSEIIL